MQEIAAVGRFEAERGAGIACQIDIEAAVGLMRQIEAIEVNERDPSDPTRCARSVSIPSLNTILAR